MGDHRLTTRQQLGLRDVAVYHDVVGLRAEVGGVVMLSDGDDEGDGLVAQRVDDSAEQVEGAVPDRSHRHIHDRAVTEASEALRRGDRHHLGCGGTQRLHRCERDDFGILQGRRARVDVQVLEQPGDRVRVEAACAPVRGGRVTGRSQQEP
jgi:hypothetical protein